MSPDFSRSGAKDSTGNYWAGFCGFLLLWSSDPEIKEVGPKVFTLLVRLIEAAMTFSMSNMKRIFLSLLIWFFVKF